MRDRTCTRIRIQRVPIRCVAQNHVARRKISRDRSRGRAGGRDEIVAVEMKLEIGGNGGSLRSWKEHRRRRFSHPAARVRRDSLGFIYALHKVTAAISTYDDDSRARPHRRYMSRLYMCSHNPTLYIYSRFIRELRARGDGLFAGFRFARAKTRLSPPPRVFPAGLKKEKSPTESRIERQGRPTGAEYQCPSPREERNSAGRI